MNNYFKHYIFPSSMHQERQIIIPMELKISFSQLILQFYHTEKRRFKDKLIDNKYKQERKETLIT
jgi:hypothetical protein